MDLVSLGKQSLLVSDAAQKEKTSFWASDCEKNVFDIYHDWIGTEPTNPFDPFTLWRFACGRAAEDELVKLFKERDVLKEEGEQYRVDFKWNGIKISGKADAKLTSGEICEIKSYYGPYQASDLKKGKPKTKYIKQLAVYMFAEKLDRGILYMVPMPAGDHYQYYIEQVSEGKFVCNDYTFDLTEEFARWKRLYKNNIIPEIEPKSEYRYKYPVNEIDWRGVRKGDITKARNNHKVIGDWQAQYNSYKNLIAQQEGSSLGYTLSEVEFIKAQTKGYSKW